MVRSHLKILGHGEDNSAGDSEGTRRRGRWKKRWKDNIKEWTGMGFGDSMRAAEDMGRAERYCCNVICGAPTTSEVKGLR